MEFNIGIQASREVNFTQNNPIDYLTESLNLFFEGKDYGDKIKKIYVGIICVSENYELFFPTRPLKILRNEPALEYEFKLDFNKFFNSNENDRLNMIIESFIYETLKTLNIKKINNFNFNKFKIDLEEWYSSLV